MSAVFGRIRIVVVVAWFLVSSQCLYGRREKSQDILSRYSNSAPLICRPRV